MAIADVIPGPEFVEFDAKRAQLQLDLLGLRLPVQTIGNTLLNGITTVTPTIRYLSLRCWLLHRYLTADPRPPNRFATFVTYARHAEAAFALGNLLRDRSTGGLIGPVKGARKLDEEGDLILIEPLAQQPAASIYSRPSDQLRLTRAQDPEVPVLGTEFGEPLALAVEAAMGQTEIADRLQRPEPLDLATRAALEEFGRVAWVNEMEDDERRALLRAVIPENPKPDDRPRIATYGLLLALAGLDSNAPLNEEHLFDDAVRPERMSPPPLHEVLDGWLLYAVRDAIAVTAEASLEAIVRKLSELDPLGAGIVDEFLVRHLVEDSAGEQSSTLRELGLGSGAEDLSVLTYRELVNRVREATVAIAAESGIARWDGHLHEPALYRAAGGVQDGALILSVVSWILADRRAGEGVRANHPEFEILSHQGGFRFGMRQVILPRLDDWHNRELSVAAVLQEFAHLTIDQHLRVAWGRLAQDPRKDVSVFLRDGDRLIRRSGYEAGRTATRLRQAIGWLHQLSLLREGRLTEEGQQVLKRVLTTLS
jgi:hypothetical protein